MKKGMELPINTLVVFLIALVVMIVVIVLFTSIQRQSGSGMSIETAKSTGCQRWISLGRCDTPAKKLLLGTGIYVEKLTCGTLTAANLEELATNCYGMTAEMGEDSDLTDSVPAPVIASATSRMCC